MGHSIDKQMLSNIVQIMEKHKFNVEVTYPPQSHILWSAAQSCIICWLQRNALAPTHDQMGP